MTENKTLRFDIDITIALNDGGDYVVLGSNCMNKQANVALINDALKGQCDDIVYLKAELDYTVDVGTDVIKIEEIP